MGEDLDLISGQQTAGLEKVSKLLVGRHRCNRLVSSNLSEHMYAGPVVPRAGGSELSALRALGGRACEYAS